MFESNPVLLHEIAEYLSKLIPADTEVLAGLEIGWYSSRNGTIIEDVVTTGGQILLSATDLRNAGANVVSVLCVIEGEAQGGDNIENEGLNFFSLFKMEELLETPCNIEFYI